MIRKSNVLLISLVIGILMVSVMWAGGQDEGDKTSVSISAAGDYIGEGDPAWLNFLVRQYEELNPDIKVVDEAYGWGEVRQKFLIAAAAGDVPWDAVMISSTWKDEFAAAGYLWEIPEDKIQDADDYLGMGVAKLDGKWYGIPFMVNYTLLYYNKNYLSEAGLTPPKTFDDWLEMNPKLTVDNDGDGRPEYYGTVFEGVDNQLAIFFLQFIQGFGGKYIQKKGDRYVCDWVNDEGRAALQLIVDLYNSPGTDPGSFTYNSDEQLDLFGTGKAVFANIWSGKPDRPQYTDPGKALNNANGSTLFPGALGSTKYKVANPWASSTINGQMGFGIAEASKQKEEALKLISFFAAPESQKLMVQRKGYTVMRKSLISDAAFVKQNPYIETALKQAEFEVKRPAYRNAAVVAAVVPTLELARAKKISVDDALKRMSEAAEAALNAK